MTTSSLIQKGSMTWADYSAHREAVKKSEGVFIGLLNDWLEPICTIDLPLVDYEAPTTDWDPQEFTASFAIPRGSERHPALKALILDSLLDSDFSGGYSPETLFVIVEPRDGSRLFYRVEYATASGDIVPETMEIHGLSPEGFLLDELPYVNKTAYEAMKLYRPVNPKLWRSSIAKDMNFAGLPVYNSNTLGKKLPGVQDTVSGALRRSSDFMVALIDREPGSEHLAVETVGDINDGIEVEQDFNTIAEVIGGASKEAMINLEIQLRLPGDADTVNRGASPVNSPRFVFVVKGGA